jgi:glycerate kinase
VKALACPDSLKGVLPAREAADALVDGLARGGAEAEALPLADGGEGTAEALYAALGGEWHTAEVTDPRGRWVEARWLLLPDGRGVVESAEAVGLWRLRPDERDPLTASSRGVGELIEAAVAGGARELVVALGGSATVDGGVGLRETLRALPVPTVAAYDVRNPLLGERGAARVFGPQKGATPDAVDELERRLAGLDELAAVRDVPGAGAAGGLGAAFAALGATLVPGIDLVLEAVGFAGRAAEAHVVVTGEGTVDSQSVEGKVVAGVARVCADAAVACVVFGGRVEPGAADALYELGASAVLPLSGDPARASADLVELGRALSGLALAVSGPSATI